MQTYAAKLATGALTALLVILLLFVTFGPRDAHAGPADDDQSVRVRVSVTTEALHGQGYWSPGIRIGQDGGFGLRIGSMRAPIWASRVPDDVKTANPEWNIQSASYIGADKEFCAQRWCGGIGITKINRTTYMNGTEWNFGLHVRYAIDRDWSLVLDHYSHASKLGYAKDKSNRGWNLIGVAYSF